MKRLTAFALAVALSIGSGLGVYATELPSAIESSIGSTGEADTAETSEQDGLDAVVSDGDNAGPDQENTAVGGENGSDDENAINAITADEMVGTVEGNEENADNSEAEKPGLQNIGQVDVSIGSGLTLERDVTFAVTLTDSQGNTKNEEIVLGGDSARSKTGFSGLPSDTYTLSVKGAGFADYTQTIAVKDKGYLVSLTTGFLAGYSYVEGGAHPGVLLIGDVNGDGSVNEADKTALVDTIDRDESADTYKNTDETEATGGSQIAEDSVSASGNLITDLNGDGATDLVDLEYLAKSYGETGDTRAMIEEFISPAVIEVKAAEGTVVNGNLDKLLQGEGQVTLSPADGAEISAEHPVALEFDFSNADTSAVVTDGILIETGNGSPIAQAVIGIAYEEDGVEYTEEIPVTSGVHYLLNRSNVYATQDKDGNIEVHLGAQVAVKKVTLTITAMTNNNNLAEISRVEFVNGMEERIPAPEMDIPENLAATAGSEEFTVTWDACVNITGYEVLIRQGSKEETIQVASNSLTVTTFCGGNVKNYTTYTVSVQSVNGSWSSGYCTSMEVTPKPTSRPDKPDNVTAAGKYQSILVNWKNMNDTQSYNLYYKVKDSEDAYTKIEGLTTNSYTITGLESLVEYEIYVTGVNELGESPESIHCAAKTTDLNPAEMPRYNLINRDEEGVPGSAHIVSVTRNGGTMVDSPSDTETGTAWGTVDNDAASYYSKSTWDDGGFNALGSVGLIYQFDQAYKMDTIALFGTNGMQYSYAQVRWWANETDYYTVRVTVSAAKDAQGRTYYLLKLPSAVTTNKVQIGLARYLATAPYQLITVSEAYFYHYDTLRDEIMALYVDDLHTVLKPEVTQETIDALRIKVNTPDAFGEENPNKELLLRELETAEKILNDEKLNAPVEIHNGITTNDVNRGFTGLNAWQPLGVTAAAGEKLTIYVGHNTKRTGDSTNLQLVATQYHAESNAMSTVVGTLKVGANEITVPKIGSSVGYESGGALYVQYTGNSSSDLYSVRVSGGCAVPILDLYKVTDEAQRLERTTAYVEALKTYTAQVEALHAEHHKDSENSNVNYDYDTRNCILEASDIMLDTMMFSLPAQQILAGAGEGSSGEQAQRILNSMEAMEDMMHLFYQHKGLNAGASAALHQIPKGHLNIRYQRMFSGAFMYASGNHIGIEWTETPGMVRAVPVVSDDEGRYISGNYFGWGIAHEIGHCINQKTYEVAEITNNYFAQLAQAKDTNAGMRFDYANIYAKVASGAKGNSSNGATQLGLYWQLHLAYDQGYNYKTYANYNEQLSNLFYARVDTYSRDTKQAPAPGGVALTLGSSTDQNLMRLACAAAQKNILEFFERWGKTPDADTIAYAEQFEKESRAIYYVSDDSRMYALSNAGSSLSADGTTQAIGAVSVNVSPAAANQVNLTMSSANVPENDVLGYEIVRCTISGGQIERTPVGFATGSSFTDTVSSMNNRAVFYEVTLIDKYLNRSAVAATGTVKIEHDGSLYKSDWTVSVTGLTADAATGDADEWLPCEPTVEKPEAKVIDNSLETVYEPTMSGTSGEILLEFNRTLTVSGLKYTAGSGTPIGSYTVQVCQDGRWIDVAQGTFDGSGMVYFANEDGAYVSTYAATAVKLVMQGQKGTKLSIAELDVLGVTGDNVDFRRTQEENTVVIGTLSADYQYGETAADAIPAGALIFTGSYKGNPAYNVVLLYDQDGNIVGGIDTDGNLKAQQIILADVPAEGNIANVSDGTWIYWVEPEALTEMQMPQKVRAELYRVNNALTNEGQRLVSDSLFETLPDVLPGITLGSSANQ